MKSQGGLPKVNGTLKLFYHDEIIQYINHCQCVIKTSKHTDFFHRLWSIILTISRASWEVEPRHHTEVPSSTKEPWIRCPSSSTSHLWPWPWRAPAPDHRAPAASSRLKARKAWMAFQNRCEASCRILSNWVQIKTIVYTNIKPFVSPVDYTLYIYSKNLIIVNA